MTTYTINPEPRLVEIVRYSIATTEEDYDISWIKGELLFRVNCSDGVVLIYYQPWPEEKCKNVEDK